MAHICILRLPPRSESDRTRKGWDVRHSQTRNHVMAENEAIVEFKVKDLFLEIKRDLTEIKTTLQSKADKAELEKIEAQVTQLEKSMASKAAVDVVQANARATRLQWVAIVVATLVGLIGIAADVFQHLR